MVVTPAAPAPGFGRKSSYRIPFADPKQDPALTVAAAAAAPIASHAAPGVHHPAAPRAVLNLSAAPAGYAPARGQLSAAPTGSAPARGQPSDRQPWHGAGGPAAKRTASNLSAQSSASIVSNSQL